MNNRVVGVAVLGAGAVAQRRHLPEYAENKNAKIIGIFDRDEKRAAEVAEIYGCKVYNSLEEALADPEVEAVSVCVPNKFHAGYAIAALKAGKHVLVEKPMATSLKDSHEMLEVWKASGKILMPDHNQRLVRSFKKAHELLSQGIIGDLLFFQCNFQHPGPEFWSIDRTNSTWFFNKDLAGFGVMGDLGVHKVDLIRYLTESEIKSVFASSRTLDKKDASGKPIDMDDNTICMFVMENGLHGIMHFSWTNYGSQEDNGAVIYGTKGVMKIFGDYTDDIVVEMRDGVQIRYSVGSISTNTNQLKSGVIDEFVGSIVEGREPVVTGFDGHQALAIVIGAEESSKKGRWIEIEY
ncbi:MAG: Gfo/Idh/MocA family oxidoreductase [Firmicutes bacterium]|nr:Gfo/Idh/MocA family oxidoreductase [Bacillota bacterium]